jgi:hypothetical protein
MKDEPSYYERYRRQSNFYFILLKNPSNPRWEKIAVLYDYNIKLEDVTADNIVEIRDALDREMTGEEALNAIALSMLDDDAKPDEVDDLLDKLEEDARKYFDKIEEYHKTSKPQEEAKSLMEKYKAYGFDYIEDVVNDILDISDDGYLVVSPGELSDNLEHALGYVNGDNFVEIYDSYLRDKDRIAYWEMYAKKHPQDYKEIMEEHGGLLPEHDDVVDRAYMRAQEEAILADIWIETESFLNQIGKFKILDDGDIAFKLDDMTEESLVSMAESGENDRASQFEHAFDIDFGRFNTDNVWGNTFPEDEHVIDSMKEELDML